MSNAIMRRFFAALVVLCLAPACAKKDLASLPPPPPPDVPFLPAAVDAYQRGLTELAKLEATPVPTDAQCTAVADLFLEAVKEQKAFDSASLRRTSLYSVQPAGLRTGRFIAGAFYNAGLARHRCGHFTEAHEHYRTVLDRDAKAYRARLQLAKIELLVKGEGALDGAIGEAQRAVLDSDYASTEALTFLARLQMQRDGSVADEDGKTDFERAKKNLHRALAVDDGYAPAQAALAQFYLASARKASSKQGAELTRGASRQNARGQALDLAFLIATQALKKTPGHAELHNTLGLIAIEAGDDSRAVKAFGEARRLDPRSFEAHMNYAAVNLSFRGFKQAEEAYRAALGLRGKDYDALLGLSLALRGQIDVPDSQDPRLAQAEELIERAKKVDPARPEAYFNHAVLVQEFKARASAEPNGELKKAIALFSSFVERAKGKKELADAVADVVSVPTMDDGACMRPGSKNLAACKRGRIHDIREIIAFNEMNAAEQKKAREASRTRDAVVEAGP